MYMNINPNRSKDEGWFENPGHQKELATAAADLSTARWGLLQQGKMVVDGD
jgi:hypothetical protein